MGRSSCRVLALTVALGGCSYATVHEPTSPVDTCAHGAPIADTVLAVTLGGTAAGAATLIPFTDGGVTLVTVALVAAAGTVVSVASARHGYDLRERCEAAKEAEAARPPRPLWSPHTLVGAACEQDRLDAYSLATASLDPFQRDQILRILPACAPAPEATPEERDRATARERGWRLIRTASLAAGHHRCKDTEAIAREVWTIDIPLHDVVLMSDLAIKVCLMPGQR